MGCARQAVLEFDEGVQAPWRPRLVPEQAAEAFLHDPRRPSVSRGSSRVGVCRPPALPGVGGATPARTAGLRGARRPARAATSPASRPGRAVAEAVRPTPVRPTPLRLTVRARRLLVLVSACAGVALGSWLGPLIPEHGGGDLRLVGVSSVVVEPGDSLWSVASSVAEGEDVRAVVDRIQELNGLEGSVVVPGQVLLLP